MLYDLFAMRATLNVRPCLPVFRGLSVLACSVLIANTISPAIAAALAYRRSHTIKTRPMAPEMKGVPRMDLRMKGIVRRSGEMPTVSLLSDQAGLSRKVTDRDIAEWVKSASRPGRSRAKADAWIRLGEVALVAKEEPIRAASEFAKAIKAAPTASPERGLGLMDRSLAILFQGRYGQAASELGGLLHERPNGLNPKRAAAYVAHARACAGYHQQRARMGITEPKEVDPLCAVASIAVCLRELGLPHEKTQVLASVRHTGEGSSLQDVVDAAPRLGVSAYPVGTTDKQKLIELPKPLVAHVEHDHFIAVTAADEDGVRYNCSDCGSWPGGFKHVSWKQWEAMEADAYAVITPRGSPLDLAMTSKTSEGVTANHPAGPAAESEEGASTAAALSAANLIESIAIGSKPFGLPYLVPNYVCGVKTVQPECPKPDKTCPGDQPDYGGPNCPMISPAGGPTGPKTGDPIDLATGESQYAPPADLNVYNSTGPSVHFGRIYNSLRNDGTQFCPNWAGFGPGWSHPYNVAVVYEPYVQGGGNGARGGSGIGGTGPYTGQVLLPNGAAIKFSWPTGAGPLSSTHLQQVQTVDKGYPLAVTEYYQPAVGLNPAYTWAIITFPDRSTWTTNGNNQNLSPFTVVAMSDRNGNVLHLGYTNVTINGTAMQPLTSIGGSGGGLALTFDSHTGMYTKVNDSYGREIDYTYNASGLLYQVSQINSSSIRYQYGYEYDGNGPEGQNFQFLDSITVPSPTGSGTSTASIHYSSYNGLLTGITDANGNTITFTGTNTQNQTTVTFANPGGTNEYQYTVGYDANMNLTDVLNAAGSQVVHAVYADPNDPFRPSSVSDGLSHTWGLSWDQFGNLKGLTTPKGTVTTNTISYTNFTVGEVTSTRSGTQTATSYTYYEPSGNLHTIKTPIPGQSGTGNQQTTTLTWTTLGNLASVQSPGNNATTYHTTTYGYTTDGSYNQNEALGQPITVTDTLGKVTHLRYDGQANLVNETDATGNEWQATYNAANQTTSIVAPATGNTGTGNATTTATYFYTGGPLTTETAYDESGNSCRSVSYTYGLEGETLSVAGDAESTSVTYGSPYWIKSLTDGNSHTTAYTYGSASDPLSGDLTKVSYPLANGNGYDTAQFVYNVMHQATQRTDGNGVVTNYGYGDGDGLLNAIIYPATTYLNVGVTYDQYDRAYYVSDGTGSITNSLDDLGDVTQSVRSYSGMSGGAKTLTYSFYPDGARSAMTTPAGNYSYNYDVDGRYLNVSTPAGAYGAHYYDNGWESQRWLANGISTNYSYNAVGGLTALSSFGNTPAFSSFTYDGVFNLTGFSANYGSGSGMPNGARTFGYDAKDRLTASGIPNGATTVNSSFGFDTAGNRTSVNGTTIPFNNDNQLSGSQFSFDGNGNPWVYNGTSLSFDPENRMTALGSTLTATYRADGLRASKATSAGTTYFLYDGGEPIIEMDSSGDVLALNVFAPDGLVARQTGSSTIEYVLDQQGNVSNRTDTGGNVLSTTQYDAWGNEQVVSGTVTDPFGYNGGSGYYLDRETGLYLCQHRFYDPANGRWLTRDPISYNGGTNLYGYCAGGPLGSADSSGEFLPLILIAILLGAAAVAEAPTSNGNGGVNYGSPDPGASVGAMAGAAAFAADPMLLAQLICGGLFDGDGGGGVSDVPDDYPPFQGPPGATLRGGKQTTTYGPDGYPSMQVEAGHGHMPYPHTHSWGRPPGGGAPTRANRGSGIPWAEGDPPLPRQPYIPRLPPIELEP